MKILHKTLPQEQNMYIPNPIAETDRYIIKVADTEEELREVFNLRFRVFNLEMHVGLDSAYEQQLDNDEFDACSLQLIIKSKENGNTVATYRIQDYEMATAGVGFCGSDRYNFSQIPEQILQQSLGVSRACIDKNHRNSKVFSILWQGLAVLLYENRLRYFFGCSSIPCSNPQDANDYVALLKAMDVYRNDFRIEALEHTKCKYRKIPVDITNTILPPLFNLYLRFKCRVCSDPCMHNSFKTLEFMILYDLSEISDKHHQLFLSNRPRLCYSTIPPHIPHSHS